MLFILIIGVSMVLSTSGSPAIENHSPAQVLRYDLETANMPNSYKFSYDSSDGTSRTEEGAILNPGTPDAALNVLGTVRWYDDKGQLYEMSYKGGKRGYQTIIKKIS